MLTTGRGVALHPRFRACLALAGMVLALVGCCADPNAPRSGFNPIPYDAFDPPYCRWFPVGHT